jgi:hypothetical protein
MSLFQGGYWYAAVEGYLIAGATARHFLMRHNWKATEYEDEYDWERRIFVLVLENETP